MTAALTIAAFIGAFAAGINFSEIIKDPSTRGWAVGIGFLAFIVFGSAAIWSGV